MKTWSQFYDLVMPDVPGLETPQADAELRNVAIAFCEETWALTADHDPVVLVVGVYEYEFDSPESHTEVFAVKAAWVDGKPIVPTTMAELLALPSDWRSTSGRPAAFAQRDSLNVVVAPPPDAVYTLDLVVAMRPTYNATGVPDRLFADYRRAIAAGVKANLMAQLGKPWSNPERSLFYRREYEAAVTRATVLTNRSRAGAGMQVRFRR